MWMIRKFHLLMLCALLTAVVYGQQLQDKTAKPDSAADEAKVSEAIAKVESGNFLIVNVETIAAAGAVEAIPVLKKQFARSHDWLIKAKLASAVVRLGDKDDVYWDFLVKQATVAVESDAPDFANLDAHAETSSGPSPQFTAWANAHKVNPQDAGEDAVYMFPAKVMLLASTGDRRAIPLLRQGLQSPNHQIEYAAAQGLAELQDKDSIPFIVRACKTAPAGAAALIARSLVYFDSPEAQAAMDAYVSKEDARRLREGRASGLKPF